MIPVSPRRRIKYYLDNYSETRPADFVTQDMRDQFALYMIIPRVSSLPKIDINVRVVVVGASDCGLSLLESLVFGYKAILELTHTVSFTQKKKMIRSRVVFFSFLFPSLFNLVQTKRNLRYLRKSHTRISGWNSVRKSTWWYRERRAYVQRSLLPRLQTTDWHQSVDQRGTWNAYCNQQVLNSSTLD